MKNTQKTFIILIFFLISSCYLTKQGYYLLKYQNKAQDIDELMIDPAQPEKKKKFLKLVKKIKTFSVKNIGLIEDKNYTQYVELEKKYLLIAVSACPKDSFKEYTWWFPFFGSFPYKGFFVDENAKEEAESLRNEGYDVYIRRVDAFSSLGIFNDPIYSFMENYSLYELASLIIHEQVHATLFIKDQIDFNENLASFIGREGALKFIEENYGKDSNEYQVAVLEIKESDTFIKLMHQLYIELNTVYLSGLAKDEKLIKREEVFKKFKALYQAEYYKNFKTERYLFIQKAEINNAYVQLFMIYEGKFEILDRLYQKYKYDLKKTVEVLKKLNDSKEDPISYIEGQLLK